MGKSEIDPIIGMVTIMEEYHWSCHCGWKTWQYDIKTLRAKALNHSKKHIKSPLKEVPKQ